MGTRGRILALTIGERLVTETCYSCGVLFAMVEDFWEHRQNDQKSFFCPNGHSQAYIGGKSDAQKLKEAEAREVALKDQLRAAIREAEQGRVQLLRDRQRFARGVCPCCNRYFREVHRHMKSEHPEYDDSAVRTKPAFRCSCGRSFDSFQGLRLHQSRQRGDRWDEPKAPSWRAHLTEVGGR